MKNNRLLIFILMFIVLVSPVNAFAASSAVVSVENVTAEINEEILVPIKLSNNPGICGATLSISYDRALKLKSITKGEALSNLTMTKPGDLLANPFNLVFDGIDADDTNGIVAYLCFEAMSNGGTYNISITYEDGDIVNGDLEAIESKMVNGYVTVASSAGNDGKEDEDEKQDGPTITIGRAIANPGGSVDVPVYMSGNTGLCGATLKIAYNESLILTDITKGDALANLIMTKPGNLSANPFKLVFDGIEQDNANGLFFTLTFTSPQGDGVYDINATYEDGDVVNGDLMPVDVAIKSGGVIVGAKSTEVVIGDETVILPLASNADGTIFVAFYTNAGKMTSVKGYNLSNSKIEVSTDSDATHAKVMCFSNNLKPLCDVQNIKIN